MYPASQELQIKRDKTRYIRNFGLAPFFKGKLQEDITQSPFFSISYDESLNHTTQECQLDVVIRYWKGDKSHVRY